MRSSVRQSAQRPMDRLQFFFSFELSYFRAPKKPRLAGHPEGATQLAREPLAVPTFIVQNGPAWSSAARSAKAFNRADISRLSPVHITKRSLARARRAPPLRP